MKLSEVKNFYSSLSPEQKKFIKELYNFIVLQESKDKILSVLFKIDESQSVKPTKSSK